MREIVWTRPAERDLKAIFDFLVDKLAWEDDKALEHLDTIFDKVETLSANYPGIGQIEPLLEDHEKEYRYLIEGNYKVIYSFDPKHFYINMVFDTRQNPNKLEERFEG